MVSAKEVAQVAVYGGPLDKKGRMGWKKRYFYLTMSQWMYYDATDASSPSFVTNASEISLVEELHASIDPATSQSTSSSSSSSKGYCFAIVVGKKRSELRAATEEDRDGWIGALAPYVKETAPLSSPHAHHPKSRSKAELTKVAEYLKQQVAFQKKKQFTADDATTILAKKFPNLALTELEAWGQTLLDAKFIMTTGPTTKDSISFGRHPGVFTCDVKKKTTSRLTANERSRISDLMSSATFDARAYAELFLKRNPPEKIQEHCEMLLDQKDAIIEELKSDICANYVTFLSAAAEIRSMDSSVSLMKSVIHDCKRSLAQLQAISLTPTKQDVKKAASASSQSKLLAAVPTPPDDMLLELEHSLEMFLFEQDYDGFTSLVLDTRKNAPSLAASALVDRYTAQFVDKVTTATTGHQTFRENHVTYLLRLHETKAATDMCLEAYSARLHSQLRTVVASGQPQAYVLAASRAFFTTLLMCYEDFVASFEGQPSSYFVALTSWIHANVAQFASEIALHIFECPDVAMAWVVRDPTELKATSKAIGASLRLLYFGARQLELAGLPIANQLAHCLAHPLQEHILSYAKAIKLKVKDEVKRERWDLLSMKIRDEKTQAEHEIALTKSARFFYGHLQQYLRDLQKLLHPSYPSSQSPKIQMAVLYETELVLLQYLQDIKTMFENPKTTTSVKYAHVVAMLSTMRYIEKDCVSRVLYTLTACLPATQLQKADFGSQIRQLWREMLDASVPRMAQALLRNSLRWNELSLASDALPSNGAASALFLPTLLHDLNSVSPDQLDIFGDQDDVTLQLLEALLQAMLDDSPWWQLVETKQKALGYGGTSRCIAELRVLTSRVASPGIAQAGASLEQRFKSMYSRVGTKKELAPDAWCTQYGLEITKDVKTKA
ncbi:hypothetical protein SDRG_07336 [Saprolegnia diclina VS20]|uniref:Exocyst complex component 8 n=1 Tax=Saprolegnia diclina (strain VS20) TaxID=1156394 RepID=T0RXN8_SAPDV|nr:hypothetical protein SDRG_07336 [Saprolegnia diclina VS20]EQC35102.1 hypothetical protein SDRG_07336 [Saprolegnia diclina VS20]|eukprot:XP_008611386.1 hypothetical protein SDRG_07336 [Saprolegnia diclina VS20]